MILLVMTGCASTQATKPMTLEPLIQERIIELPPVRKPELKPQESIMVEAIGNQQSAPPLVHVAYSKPPEKEVVPEAVQAPILTKHTHTPIVIKPDEPIEVTTGAIMTDIPKEMYVGKTFKVSATILSGIAGEKAVAANKADKILVGQEMRAVLEGKGFKITLKGSETQRVDERLGSTTWNWDVVPVWGGESDLTVRVFLVIPNRAPKDLNVYTEKIHIKRDLIWSIEYFIKENWEKILGGLGGIGTLIGIYLAMVKWRKENGSQKAPTDQAS
jgi:hypothetical protein